VQSVPISSSRQQSRLHTNKSSELLTILSVTDLQTAALSIRSMVDRYSYLGAMKSNLGGPLILDATSWLYSVKAHTDEMFELSDDYVPGHWDVICQRGKECFEHGMLLISSVFASSCPS
jgi:hypothetical protein